MDSAGASVLDVGCGVGLLTITLAASSNPRRIYGFDVNPYAVTVAEAAAKCVASVLDLTKDSQGGSVVR
jgi:16S rRNA G1207 methylase RsmC